MLLFEAFGLNITDKKILFHSCFKNSKATAQKDGYLSQQLSSLVAELKLEYTFLIGLLELSFFNARFASFWNP